MKLEPHMIAAEVLDRFARLRDMTAVAIATSDGLRPALEHAREEAQRQEGNLMAAARNYGGHVTVEEGRAILTITNRREKKDARGSLVTWTPERSFLPDLDHLAVDVHRARTRLAEAREQQGKASQRAASLKQMVDEAREALAAHGWREDR